MASTDRSDASIKLKVQPRAPSNQVVGYEGDFLRVRVTAPPEGGKANQAVVALLAQALGIAKSRVTIVRGHGSRNKVVEVASLTEAEVQERLRRAAS